MAKLIILEGLSRTGKTTISNYLKNNGYGRLISLKNKMPKNCDLYSFYKGCNISYDAFLSAFPEETFILDRSFLSEMVFSRHFSRQMSITKTYILDFVRLHQIKLFYLTNSHEDYLKRSPKENYSKTDYEKLNNLFHSSLSFLEDSITWNEICTSSNTLEETINIITNKI